MKTALLFLFSIVIPIPVFLRMSVSFYQNHHFGDWTSIILGFIVALIVWSVFGWFVLCKLNKIRYVVRIFRKIAVFVFVFQLALGSVYISGAHLKNESLKESYRQVHPILRMSIVVSAMISPDLVMTDLSRSRQDYQRMGLPRKEFSLHFVQPSGYVHAIDIRTKGKSEIRNSLLHFGFWICGFSTKRHVGTADHLHVSLQPS